jgi:hypothetical protein
MANDHTLTLPIDASGIEDRSDIKALKAVLIDSAGAVQSAPVKLSREGQAQATFKLQGPNAARILVGPAEASDEQMQGLQTLAVDVPLRAWAGKTTLELAPLLVRPFYWHWWRRWCRTFTIRGRVLCPDGSPVPGAVVCANDVDRFWWWCSEEQVACATTDADGVFSMSFRWCCGWWPWRWWSTRHWRIDPSISERIAEALQRNPKLPPLPPPGPVPELGLFDALLARDGVPTGPAAAPIDDPAALDGLRLRVLEQLPAIPSLEVHRIWPWAPWHPWWDCTPDINFKITQNCGQGEVVILDEGCADTRWNIPTTLDVTLVTSDDACCVHPRDPRCPHGECLVLSHICDDLVSTIGGNIGAAPAPEGYRSPGAIATHGDRPYAGIVPVKGVCGDWIDYYEFEMSTDGMTWNALPPNSTGGFTHVWFNPAGPPWFVPVGFNFANVDGKWVIESLAHWESVHGAKIWVGDITTLLRWKTTTPSSPTGPTALFADDTYYLRLKAWKEAGGNLSNPSYPTLCGTNDENQVVVTLDNRMVGPGAGHPTTPDHPCVGVHLCTTEPDTDFVAIRINGNPVGPCAIVDGQTGTLEIDFLAHDPDGHLAYYSLHALWGENNSRNLLSPVLVPSGNLTRLSAAQAGPSYGAARAGSTAENTPAATAPTWHGGTMRLTIGNIREAFPDPCCYLLDLRTYKRTIDSCDDDYEHNNRSTFTFTVT